VPFTENAGSYINLNGTWQRFQASTKPMGEARPAWKIFRVLGNLFKLEGFTQESASEITDSLQHSYGKKEAKELAWYFPEKLSVDERASLTRVSDWAIYSTDNVVRRAKALQESGTQAKAQMWIHPNLASSLQLSEGDKVRLKQGTGTAELNCVVNENMSPDCIMTKGGLKQMVGLGFAFGKIQESDIEKI